MKRKKLSRKHSEDVFEGAARVHPRNNRATPMRGGIRL